MNRNISVVIGLSVVAIFVLSGFSIAVNNSYGGNNLKIVGTQNNVLIQSTVHASSISAQFGNWYNHTYNGQNPSSLANLSTSQRNKIFANFIHSDPSAQRLLSIKSRQSVTIFNTIDHLKAEKTFANLMNRGKVIVYNKTESFSYNNQEISVYYHSGSVSSLLVNIKTDLPSGVSFDSGEWVLVSINYFVYQAPWWLGGWSATYGEHDVINSLYAGSSAQKYYNSVTSATTDEAILDDIAIGAIGVGLAFASLSMGISAIAGGIIAAALVGAGAVVSVLAAVWVGDLTSLYESTYANEPSGNKYIWVYDSVNYYYPWITVGGSLDSSIGMYGYLSNGNVVTFMPNVPFVIFGGIGGVGGVEYAASLSGYTHSISNKIGLNDWAYAGAS